MFHSDLYALSKTHFMWQFVVGHSHSKDKWLVNLEAA
jgi:hypothetical protein